MTSPGSQLVPVALVEPADRLVPHLVRGLQPLVAGLLRPADLRCASAPPRSRAHGTRAERRSCRGRRPSCPTSRARAWRSRPPRRRRARRTSRRAGRCRPACPSRATPRTSPSACPRRRARRGTPRRPPRRGPRELGPLRPGHDLDALRRVDRGSLDRGQVEHHLRVPPDLAEAAPVDPREALGVVLGHGRLERDAAPLLHPPRDPLVERRPDSRTAVLRQHEDLAVPGARLRVPADVGERGAGVLAVLRRDEPHHVLGLALPVDVLADAAAPVGPDAAGDRRSSAPARRLRSP